MPAGWHEQLGPCERPLHNANNNLGIMQRSLDPLWSDGNLDFIGIDNYLPLADWRDGSDHLDYDAKSGRTAIYDLDYLKSNIEGGEYYDWYYASDADRAAQKRTPISDHYGQPWVWRQKAIRDWWQRFRVDLLDPGFDLSQPRAELRQDEFVARAMQTVPTSGAILEQTDAGDVQFPDFVHAVAANRPGVEIEHGPHPRNHGGIQSMEKRGKRRLIYDWYTNRAI